LDGKGRSREAFAATQGVCSKTFAKKALNSAAVIWLMVKSGRGSGGGADVVICTLLHLLSKYHALTENGL
jgi:hypothetical protein